MTSVSGYTMSVGRYWELIIQSNKKFKDHSLRDSSLDRLPIDCQCGRDCVRVIDGFKVMLETLDLLESDDFLSLLEDKVQRTLVILWEV